MAWIFWEISSIASTKFYLFSCSWAKSERYKVSVFLRLSFMIRSERSTPWLCSRTWYFGSMLTLLLGISSSSKVFSWRGSLMENSLYFYLRISWRNDDAFCNPYLNYLGIYWLNIIKDKVPPLTIPYFYLKWSEIIEWMNQAIPLLCLQLFSISENGWQ